MSAQDPRKELTIRGLVLGAAITLVFTAANIFLGLKVGLTFASSIPAAVISMAILRNVKSATIQENNIVQTVASAAGTLSSVIFVLPGLVIIGWWAGFPFWEVFAICFLGGTLGVMYSIPLRRALVTHSDLPYPEGVAAAELLKVGSGAKATEPEAIAESKAGVRAVVAGSIVSTLYALLATMKVFAADMARFYRFNGGVTGLNPGFSFALLGVGHLVGISVGAAMAVGLAIAWLGFVPYYTAQLPNIGDDLGAVAIDVFRHKVRFVGAGAIAVAAIWTLLKLIGPVWGGLMSAIAASRARSHGGTGLPRTELDIPIGLVGLISIASLVPIALLLQRFITEGGLQNFSTTLIVGALIYIVIVGLFIAAVVGYMAGLIGSSNSPLSGVGILAVIGASVLLAAFIKPQVGEDATKALIAFALFVTGVVFTIGTISNDNLQDLKTGQLVDATPWKQQASLVFGCLAGAIVIPPILVLVHKAYGFAGMAGAGPQALPAPQANLISDLARGVLGGDLNWRDLGIGVGVGIAIVLIDEILGFLKILRLPPLAVGLAVYLPMSATFLVVVGAILGWLYEKTIGRGEIAKRLGVLLASGLIVGESLFGVLNAGIIVAAKGDLLAFLGMGKDDPRTDNPLGIMPDSFASEALTYGITAFAVLALGLYVWTAAQSRLRVSK
ncbi:MAG: oligopeptide transporter, OPT family [Alphaproteobacteria bacterium]